MNPLRRGRTHKPSAHQRPLLPHSTLPIGLNSVQLSAAVLLVQSPAPTADCIFLMIAEAYADVFSFCAPAIMRATVFQTKKSDIISAESITELGLITSLSAYFGAVPCVASKTPKPSPIFAPGAMPRPPTCAAQASER